MAWSMPSWGAPESRLRGPSVQARVGLVFGLTALLFTVFTLAMQRNHRLQVESMVRERAAETERVLARVVELRASGARIHVDDYTRWDEFVEFVAKPEPTWGRVYLTESIGIFNLDAAWILNERFAHVFTAIPSGDSSLAGLPVSAEILANLLAKRPVQHFFVETVRGPMELWTSSIQPADDSRRETPARGYYIAGRLWTPERLTELAAVAGGEVRIIPPTGRTPSAVGSSASGRIDVETTLPGIHGRPFASLALSAPFMAARQLDGALRMSSLFAMVGALLSLIAVWWAMSHWVARPLAAITTAMEHEDVAALAPVHMRHDELGNIARLIEEFFAQREQLLEANRAAQAAVLAKSNFLSNISHELRTPMHGILSFSRFGLRDAESATRQDLRENFQQINQCGESLLALLNSLLDLSKLEAGRMSFEYAPVPLQEVVDLAMDEFRSAYRERDIRLRADFGRDLAEVLADRARLLQVVRNLISNAAKFTPAGGEVHVRITTTEQHQCVIVEDSGIGIPQGEESVIFNKFTQASHTDARSGGTGLGLAICREIIEAHDGRIWAENRAEGGARVTFELPIAGPAEARDPNAATIESGAAATDPVTDASDVHTRVTNANDRWRRAA